MVPTFHCCYNNASVGLSGYVVTDVTGDDFVDGTDVSIVYNNASMVNWFCHILKAKWK